MMVKQLHGTIRGDGIELDSASGLPDGTLVTILLEPEMPTPDERRDEASAWPAIETEEEFLEVVYTVRDEMCH